MKGLEMFVVLKGFVLTLFLHNKYWQSYSVILIKKINL